jgi:hypothetical protein
MDEQKVVQCVREAVEAYRSEWPKFPEVVIPEGGARQDDDWFYVAVSRRPPYDDMRAFEYYDHLNAIEKLLKQEHGIKVLLVPARAAA